MLDKIHAFFVALGTLFSISCGGMDQVFMVLITLSILDVIAGLMAAFKVGPFSFRKFFAGSPKKLFIYIIIVMAVALDRIGLTSEPIFRTLAIWYYIGYEGLSVLKHAAVFGLPIPGVIKKALEQAQEKGEAGNG